MENGLLTRSQLAALLGRHEATVANDISRNPQALPPSIVLPGTRCRRWRVADVERWLQDLPSEPPKPKRGRPKK
jgi:predicted DNA-binding transcriptional regulator AlpA